MRGSLGRSQATKGALEPEVQGAAQSLAMTSLLPSGPPIRLSAFLDVNRPRTSQERPP